MAAGRSLCQNTRFLRWLTRCLPVLRVYIMILQTLDIRDTRQCKDPGVPRRVLSTSLLMALLLYIVGPDTSGRVLSSSDMLRTEPGRDHQCMAACDCSVVTLVCSDWWPPWAGKKAEICVSQGPGRWRCEACPIFISRISHFLISFHNNTIIKISSGAIPGYFGISSLILSTRPTWG